MKGLFVILLIYVYELNGFFRRRMYEPIHRRSGRPNAGAFCTRRHTGKLCNM